MFMFTVFLTQTEQKISHNCQHLPCNLNDCILFQFLHSVMKGWFWNSSCVRLMNLSLSSTALVFHSETSSGSEPFCALLFMKALLEWTISHSCQSSSFSFKSCIQRVEATCVLLQHFKVSFVLAVISDHTNKPFYRLYLLAWLGDCPAACILPIHVSLAIDLTTENSEGHHALHVALLTFVALLVIMVHCVSHTAHIAQMCSLMKPTHKPFMSIRNKGECADCGTDQCSVCNHRSSLLWSATGSRIHTVCLLECAYPTISRYACAICMRCVSCMCQRFSCPPSKCVHTVCAWCGTS